MQTLSPTISPTVSPTSAKPINQKAAELGNDLPAIAQSLVAQTALAGFDASLNDELDRYRHWQENGQTISYLNPFRPRTVSTQSIWTSPSLSDALAPIAPPTDTNSDRRTIQMPNMLPMGANASSLSSSIAFAELHEYKGLDSLEKFENTDLDETLPYPQHLNSYPDISTDISMGFGSPTMAKVPEPDDDEILQSFANDYAENYQDSINQDAEFPISGAPSPKSALRSLMNPVGIISLLLLLCSSAAIGYLMVDPSGVIKLFKPESRTKAAQTDAKNDDLGSDINLRNQQKSSGSSLSFVPFAGDKTQSETTDKNKALTNPAIASKNPLTNPPAKSSNLFVPSNNSFVPNVPLRTVPSTSFPSISVAPLPPALAPLERSYSPPEPRSYEAPSAPSYRESAPRSYERPTAAPSSSRANTSAPTAYVAPSAPVYVEPPSNTPPRNTAVKYAAPLSSAPVPTAPVEAPAQAPTQSSYRVVVENSYAASAQQVERDAYVRPSDGQVQVGSYRDSNSAQQRIEQLRRQGIPAKIE